MQVGVHPDAEIQDEPLTKSVADEGIGSVDELLDGIDRYQQANKCPQTRQVRRADDLIDDRFVEERWYQFSASSGKQQGRSDQ